MLDGIEIRLLFSFEQKAQKVLLLEMFYIADRYVPQCQSYFSKFVVLENCVSWRKHFKGESFGRWTSWTLDC